MYSNSARLEFSRLLLSSGFWYLIVQLGAGNFFFSSQLYSFGFYWRVVAADYYWPSATAVNFTILAGVSSDGISGRGKKVNWILVWELFQLSHIIIFTFIVNGDFVPWHKANGILPLFLSSTFAFIVGRLIKKFENLFRKYFSKNF